MLSVIKKNQEGFVESRICFKPILVKRKNKKAPERIIISVALKLDPHETHYSVNLKRGGN